MSYFVKTDTRIEKLAELIESAELGIEGATLDDNGDIVYPEEENPALARVMNRSISFDSLKKQEVREIASILGISTISLFVKIGELSKKDFLIQKPKEWLATELHDELDEILSRIEDDVRQTR